VGGSTADQPGREHSRWLGPVAQGRQLPQLGAGRATGSYVNDLPFLDSDVYKWLEAVAWRSPIRRWVLR
jgi:DUF1680 family protein